VRHKAVFCTSVLFTVFQVRKEIDCQYSTMALIDAIYPVLPRSVLPKLPMVMCYKL